MQNHHSSYHDLFILGYSGLSHFLRTCTIAYIFWSLPWANNSYQKLSLLDGIILLHAFPKQVKIDCNRSGLENGIGLLSEHLPQIIKADRISHMGTTVLSMFRCS